jgi:monoamine oxidase
MATLRKVARMAFWAEAKDTNSGEAVDLAREAAWSRRRFLEATGKGLLLTGAAPMAGGLIKPTLLGSLQKAVAPRIAIVGGGMAGLSALHTLKKAGMEATVYEASGRTSGRIFTVQNAMGEGTWAEFGAEFIDTNHADMWALAKEFNIELIDYAQPSETALKTETFFFDGKHYSIKDSVDAFRTFAPRMKKDMDKLADAIDWETKDKFTKKMDNTSLSEYLEKVGAKGWIKRFIEASYESEYGLSPDVQSALNLLLLISPDTEKGHIELFGESDERYKARGGNQRIPDALAKKYAGNIELNRSLESIRANSNGSVNLHFAGMAADVVADYVIVCIPFTKLRECELKMDMPAKKRECINTLGYGTNAKLMLGMKSHFWREQGYGGLVYSDNGVPNGWDNAQLQTPANGPAGLSILFGGPSGVKVGEGTPESQKDIYLPKWNQIFPGATQQHNGKVSRMHWPSYQYNKGSYICYTTGQFTSISGWEATPVGNVYFAGEHCGGDFAGYMNGAAQSGREAAELIVKKMD